MGVGNFPVGGQGQFSEGEIKHYFYEKYHFAPRIEQVKDYLYANTLSIITNNESVSANDIKTLASFWNENLKQVYVKLMDKYNFKPNNLYLK